MCFSVPLFSYLPGTILFFNFLNGMRPTEACHLHQQCRILVVLLKCLQNPHPLCFLWFTCACSLIMQKPEMSPSDFIYRRSEASSLGTSSGDRLTMELKASSPHGPMMPPNSPQEAVDPGFSAPAQANRRATGPIAHFPCQCRSRVGPKGPYENHRRSLLDIRPVCFAYK
ncbi:hypothetical protein GGR54DRAFT_85547 [Hypoxylon sp. NC1633]|nr:hypothetical protein GGR54DRAFT_85547 [Hypoxylon sp. NC1633]